MFLFAGPHLGFVADVLGAPLNCTRRLHASVGLVSVVLAVFHATVCAITKGMPSVHHSRELFAVVAIVLICAQFAPLSLRRFSYEIALRAHQLLSFGLAYAIWRHLPSAGLFPRLYIYISAGLFSAGTILQLMLILYRNNLGLSRARISYDLHTIKVRLYLRRPLKVEAGQYINLWIPSASLSSFTQTHPFTVVSWSEKPQGHIDLFIEPRRGLTKDLFGLSEYGPTTSIVMFSGPHGRALSADHNENVLLIASGFGIAAQLPFVKKLIYDHHNRRTLVRRIHLVWQIDNLDIGIAAQQLLNDTLADNSVDRDYILRISIYLTSEHISKASFRTKEVAERRPKSSTIILVSVSRAAPGLVDPVVPGPVDHARVAAPAPLRGPGAARTFYKRRYKLAFEAPPRVQLPFPLSSR
ncbi:hypothetical protein HIM_11106 [Hirsutella minnesotensis 3608]|uniref:ferric-chelate reductase (NADPH) n=1 Tax=Hirsutella minnesotensis 3608 TaxID=1043627 RepID=A0A0F8A1K8_9HYPO|nr:hypothetical protein HIM_11106 [Hirsutella minnesotensis 3608]